ncbi:class I SAM-dependent methyltransferase [Roseibium algae]|uniref:Class I SAM-dependent methyltransferase n=1 Tax=Roseibium algae TaxID=3123038 RepID=A0ABU8TQT0_9HYPH
MTGFSAEWLDLREPVDLAARNDQVEHTFFSALPQTGPVRILDLASGAGSTVAALSHKLNRNQTWLLTDNDHKLLDVANSRFGSFQGLQVQSEILDLSREMKTLSFDSFDAITTSAFLDLVTEEFLANLVEQVVASQKPFLASLSYDGRAICAPADPLDDTVRQAMNMHQQTDKGFGAALGPRAWSVAASLFRLAGYDVMTGASDWTPTADSQPFLKLLLEGWGQAASEVGVNAAELDRWRSRRLSEISDQSLSVCVGHQDLVALPR